ncbi:MAG: hypothetical protein IJQ34_07785 [Kiritimatiellae bacterium]|nr:hypothetical protein [Kiritimatiellia bacterium]
MLEAIQVTVATTAALCMILAAARHYEWRGGLMLAGFIFLASAANGCEKLWRALLPEVFHEPELLPITLLLATGIALAFRYRGTTRVGLMAIWRNRRFPLLVWGLIFISILPNVAKSKVIWETFASAAKAPHALREGISSAVELFGCVLLLNWALLFLKDKRKVFARRTSSLNHLVFENQLTEIGRGTRRVAYKVGETGYCVKFYYPQEQCIEALKMQKSIQRDVKWRRFNKHRNSSSEEVHIYNILRHTMPEEIRVHMPPLCERVFHPIWGWGIIETFYTDPDGSAILPYEDAIRKLKTNPEKKREIYIQARQFLLLLIKHSALFYEPGNLHVLHKADGSLELKLVDFEPESKTAIPLEIIWPWFRRRKLRRKARRYLKHIRERYDVDVEVETEIG